MPKILVCFFISVSYVSGCRRCYRSVHGAAARDPLHHGPGRPAARGGHRVPEQRPLSAVDADPSVPLHLPRLHLDPAGPGPRPDKIGRRDPAGPPHRPSGLQDPAHLAIVKRC